PLLPPLHTRFPYTTLFRSGGGHAALDAAVEGLKQVGQLFAPDLFVQVVAGADGNGAVLVAVAPDDLRDDVEQLRRHGDDPFPVADRKSTRLNSTHVKISYA